MDYEQKLVNFINMELLGGNGDISIGSDTELLDNGIIDSINMIKILTFIEQDLSIQLMDDDLLPDNFNSVNSISRIINKYAD